MGDASYSQSSFLGGEWSAFSQGRFDKPEYRTALNVCLNALPIEDGCWTRRPGTQHAGPTRSGLPAIVRSFDFEQASPYTIEFTDGNMRFRSGASVVAAADAQKVASISTANPAVVATKNAHGWATGASVAFSGLGLNNAQLQARRFIITVTGSKTFSLVDELTGAPVDGATLGAFVSGTVARALELASPYISGTWGTLRLVQAETTAMLLNGLSKPNALTVDTLPTATAPAAFSVNPANFMDGPYLDPVGGGVLAVPNALSGVIDLTVEFAVWAAGNGYSKGDLVTFSGASYVSLVDANADHQPDVSPAQWATTTTQHGIVNPNGVIGFQTTDVGRSIRLFSEPALWNSGSSYTTGQIVAYAQSGQAATYWAALQDNSGVQPGIDTTNWQLVPAGAAVWTWGRITGLLTLVDPALAGSIEIGDLTGNGGLPAAFDGQTAKGVAGCAVEVVADITSTSVLSGFIGKDYGAGSPQRVGWVSLFPSTDEGLTFAFIRNSGTGGLSPCPLLSVVMNLRGSQVTPATIDDGTLLGSINTPGNPTLVETIQSSDQVTQWRYVWIEVIATYLAVDPGTFSVVSATMAVSQMQVFNPPGTGTGNGVTVQIMGPPLLYTTAILTWRMGLYSDTTGWPTCGCYHEGRLWLSGAVANRIDGSMSNGVDGGTVQFSPTGPDGTVADNNGISYTFDSSTVNPIFWMAADQRGIVCGTQEGEWLVQASDQNNILTPTSIQAHRATKNGCANIEPRRTGLTLVFVQRYVRRLMEYFADVISGKFTSPNLSANAKHLTQPGLAELAYQEELAPIVWGRCVDGSLVGTTYKREVLYSSQGPSFNGWHRHALGSGRIVESICAGPSVGGALDSVTMVTNDPATNIRHVEVMTDIFDEDSALDQAWFLDDAATPSSYTVNGGKLIMNGLWHLNGKTVSVFAGGLDVGDATVSNGTAEVDIDPPNGIFTDEFIASFGSAMPIVVGFTYTSDGQLLRPVAPQETGARNGPALGKKRRNHHVAVLFQDAGTSSLDGTAAISFGTGFGDDDLRSAIFETPGGQPVSPLDKFSGVYWASLTDDYSFDGMICWRVTRPLPATITAIEGFIQTQDQ